MTETTTHKISLSDSMIMWTGETAGAVRWKISPSETVLEQEWTIQGMSVDENGYNTQHHKHEWRTVPMVKLP